MKEYAAIRMSFSLWFFVEKTGGSRLLPVIGNYAHALLHGLHV